MFSSARNLRNNAPRKQAPRREERVAVSKAAMICVDGDKMALPCTVRDLHNHGARISVANVNAVPDVFLLIVRSEDVVARASVAWRKSSEIGVRFIRSGQLFDEEKFRREQAASYKKDQEKILLEKTRSEQELKDRQAAADMQMQQSAHEKKRLMQFMGLDMRYPASEESIKQAYRKQAMLRHPDHGGSIEEFQELNNVYRALMSSVSQAQQGEPIRQQA